MAVCVLCPEQQSLQELLLSPEDFPPTYLNCAHPNDYQLDSAPIEMEAIFNHRHGPHNRLLLRIAWQLGPAAYVPMTFVLDTGAPKQLYLSQQAMNLLEKNGLLHEDEDADVAFVELFGRKCPVERTPAGHAPANLMGVKLLMRLGLKLQDSPPYFDLQAIPLSYLAS